MRDIPTEWQEHIEDQEYFMQLWNPEFIELEGLILLKAHYNPANFQQWMEKATQGNLEKLENTINHVHLDYFDEDSQLQHQIGETLTLRWKEVLKQTFPDKDFEINLVIMDDKTWELQLWTKRQ
jgi:hypothetical protein